MTSLIFLDEQEGHMDGEPFTAIAGFRIPTSQHVRFREAFYPEYVRIIEGGLAAQGEESVFQAPILHGSDFLPGHSDSTKFAVLDHLFGCLRRFDSLFYRVGYFNQSMEFAALSHRRQAIIDLCWINIWWSLQDSKDDFIFVHEVDREALKKRLGAVTEQLPVYYRLGQESISVPLDKLVGHYYSPKFELGCQVADVAAYVALKSATARSDFGRRVREYLKQISESFLINRIIWMEHRP